MPFLSIIIPVYNKDKYLDKCLQSIVSQSFTDWELILVDDGSSDESGAICDRWQEKDARVQVIHQGNSGVSTARNNALKRAKGRYIQFTDADDWWSPGAFESLYAELQEYNYPDMLIFGMTKVYPNGTCKPFHPERKGLLNRETFLSNLIIEQSQTGIYGGAWNKWTARYLIEKHGVRFNAQYNLIEDYDFYLSSFEHCSQIALSHRTDYNYLQEAENSTFSPSFKFHYPHVMAIRMKAYNLVERICGKIIENEAILQKELEDHYLGMYVELKHISYQNIITLHREVIALLERKFTLKPYGTSFNTKIISFLIRKQLFRILNVYLKLRKHISHA